MGGFRLRAEIKLGYRYSQDLVFRYNPASIGPAVMETPSPGSSFEIQTVNLVAAGNLTDGISAKVEVHLLDLYNRNPTSSGDRVELREAWVRFGRKDEALRPIQGTSVYLEAGKFPRFSKQVERRLESYDLWGTAVGRFEEVGLEGGGSFGRNVYWRGQVVSGNPLFLRDVMALAGDNGTEEPVHHTGFPILYDAKATGVSFGGRVQVGGGLGFRAVSEDGARGVDLLAWGFRRELRDSVPIRGSTYGGDIDLLDGVPPPGVVLDGRTKWEAGANLAARVGGLRLGIVRGVDLTAEYSRHWMKTRSAWLHADETVVTLRAAF